MRLEVGMTQAFFCVEVKTNHLGEKNEKSF